MNKLSSDNPVLPDRLQLDVSEEGSHTSYNSGGTVIHNDVLY